GEQYQQGYVPFGGADVTVAVLGSDADPMALVRQDAAASERRGDRTTLRGLGSDGSVREDQIFPWGNRPRQPYHIAFVGLVRGGKGFHISLDFWDDDPRRDDYERALAGVVDSLSVQEPPSTPATAK